MLHHVVDLDEGIGSLQPGLKIGVGWGLCLKGLKEKVENQEVLKQARASTRQVFAAYQGALEAAQAQARASLESAVAETRKVVETTLAESRKTVDVAVKEVRKIEAVKRAEKQVTTLNDQTAKALGKLEAVFQDRVSRTLSRLGVPSSTDLRALAARVEELTDGVNALAGAPRTAARRKAAAAA